MNDRDSTAVDDAIATAVSAHAVDIDSGRETGMDADSPVVAASVFKLPVLVEYVRQVAAGELDPARQIRVPGGSGTIGTTGLSVFSDDTVWSLRDLATSMITVSDNAATDLVMALTGIDRINATMADLGLPGTVLVGDCAAIFASMAAEYGVDDVTAIDGELLADPGRVERLSVCTPELTNRTTPRETTALLRMLWTDAAATPEACAEARRILGLQIWPHRLSSGFPRDDVRISGKTGTLGVVRNEAGVVEFPDGRRYAVAVFLRTKDPRYRNPDADRLIGSVARSLVDQLAGNPVGVRAVGPVEWSG